MKNSLAPVAFETFETDDDPKSGTYACVEAHVIDPVALAAPRPVSEVTSTDLRDYMYLVRGMVARFLRRVPPSVQRDDLVAAGTIGLMDALAKHVGERDARFEWYARVRIRGAILDELRQQDWLSRRARARIIDPSRPSLRPTVVAVDDLHGGAQAHEPQDDDLAERHDGRVALSDAIRQLPARERGIVEMHYIRGVQFREIAETLGVSVPRVSQLHARAIEMLRELLAAEHGDAFSNMA
jgi:RNA polymerase sigma factor for flagellar operon FliA